MLCNQRTLDKGTLRMYPYLSVPIRMSLVMLLPTRFVAATTTPALVLITDWLTKFT